MMFEATQDDRQALLAKAIDEAGGYVPRNPEVLQRLHAAVFRPLPPDSSHAQLAYAEGQRALVMMIIRQYQLAMTGSLETPWASGYITPQQTTGQQQAEAVQPQKQRRRARFSKRPSQQKQ